MAWTTEIDCLSVLGLEVWNEGMSRLVLLGAGTGSLFHASPLAPDGLLAIFVVLWLTGALPWVLCLHLHTAFRRSSVSLCLNVPFLWGCQFYWIILTNCIFNDPASKQSHILKYQWLELQHMNLGKTQSIHKKPSKEIHVYIQKLLFSFFKKSFIDLF